MIQFAGQREQMLHKRIPLFSGEAQEDIQRTVETQRHTGKTFKVCNSGQKHLYTQQPVQLFL